MRMNYGAAAALLAVSALGAGGVAPRTFVVNAAQSHATIEVGKAGMFSFMAGHVHEVDAPLQSGVIHFNAANPAASDLHLEFDSSALRVTGKGDPPNDVPKVQAVMVGEQVLDVAKYPKIAFDSTSVKVEAGGGGGSGAATAAGRGPASETTLNLTITGTMTLHGTRNPVTVQVTATVDGQVLTASGQFTLKQTDYGIKPVSVAGVVKVKDAMDISFRIVARESSGAA